MERERDKKTTKKNRGIDRDKESEREPQCEYGMNVNGLWNALDENKNQM